MNLINELKWRGTIKDVTNDDFFATLEEKKIVFYIGFDPTGDSLHVGSLLQIVNTMRLANYGCKGVILTGGFTGLIGDPSGKNVERKLLTLEEVQINESKIKNQLMKIINNENIIFESNYTWFGKMTLLDFLRFTGKSFNISEMIKKDIVSSRMQSGISFTEFSYQTLQAHDWTELYERYGVNTQFGGSDQWGNLTAGTELLRKKFGVTNSYGVTTPLVKKSDGNKFGKSETGTIWLDKEKTSEYELFQFFYNSYDKDVIDYLKYFTFLSYEEITNLEEKVKIEPFKREAQKVLAYEVVKLVHGEEGLSIAKLATEALFKNQISNLKKDVLLSIMPSLNNNSYKTNEDKTYLIDALISTGLAKSKREGREFLKANAIRVNDLVCSEENMLLDEKNALFDKYFILKRGKKKIGALIINE